jgi:hypothetical protein
MRLDLNEKSGVSATKNLEFGITGAGAILVSTRRTQYNRLSRQSL